MHERLCAACLNFMVALYIVCIFSQLQKALNMALNEQYISHIKHTVPVHDGCVPLHVPMVTDPPLISSQVLVLCPARA